MATAGGDEGQLAAVGEEEAHSTLDFDNHGQWGGWGVLQWLSKGARGALFLGEACANASATATGCSC